MIRLQIFVFIFLTGFLMSNGDDVKKEVLNFFIYGTSTSDFDKISLKDAHKIYEQNMFDPDLPTVIYIPGYTQKPDHEHVQKMMTAYIEKNDGNVILFDWSAVSGGNYVNTLKNVPKVAELLTEVLAQLIVHGLKASSLTLVGTSLGAQISGQVGRNIKKHNIILQRIVGLDPAFPGFFHPEKSVKSGDAAFVFCLHTDAGIYGTPYSVCDVDAWANGGTRTQPGCPFSIPMSQSEKDFCSHQLSVLMWIEAVNDQTAFVGVKCVTHTAFKSESCDFRDIIPLGPNTPKLARGKYYFRTNSEPPYGRGVRGTKNNK